MEESASSEVQIAIPKEENEELLTEIKKIFEIPEIQIQPSTPCRICKVPRLLRNWNEEAYTPQEVSIGPYHRKNERLKAMEEHKERYFRSFVYRSEINLECLVGTVREMEKMIRGCYEETIETIDLTRDMFVKMILVDACFILELFFTHSSTWEEDDTMRAQPRSKAIIRDLLLLENQLPFFVIEKIYNLAFPSFSKDRGLLELSSYYFGEFNNQNIAPHPNVKIEHFTDLLRTFQIPPPEKLPRRVNQHSVLWYSATQLHDVGVKFGVRISKSCFDMKFERGVLMIPRLEFDDWTEVVIRNIMALEQTCYIENAYFTDYFLFMDSLMKTRKDVDLLSNKGILVNYLGDNDAAKFMISHLNRGIFWKSMRGDYVDLCQKLNSFCSDPGRIWKAELKREYFGTPSQAASTIISLGVITVLTLIQTVCSIMQVTGSS